MSRDLALGTTPRDWSCGAFPVTTPAVAHERYEDAVAETEVGPLARLVEAETFRNFQKILSLQAAGKMPPADRKAYGRFVARWQEFRRQHNGKFAGADYVALTNFRDENRRHASRLAEIEKSPPASPPPSAPGTAPRDAGAAGLRLVKHSVVAALGTVLVARLWGSKNRY